MKFTKNQLISCRNSGIIYQVYGLNTRNKTYHIKAIFIPTIAGPTIKEGDKFNLSVRKQDKYLPITNN